MSSVGFLIFDGLWREISARVSRFVRSASGRTAEKRRNLARSKMRGFLRVQTRIGERTDRNRTVKLVLFCKSLVSVGSGALIDGVATLFFSQSNEARRLTAEFFDKLRLDRQF